MNTLNLELKCLFVSEIENIDIIDKVYCLSGHPNMKIFERDPLFETKTLNNIITD